MKRLLLLMMSVAALTLNAQVYTEYFTETDPQSDGTAGVAFAPGDQLETGDAQVDGYYGWYLSAKSTNREVGANGEASPLISSEDAMWYPDYIGSEKGQLVKYDSAVAYVSDQRDNFWAVNDGAGDTLKLDTEIGVIYTAFLFKPMANSKNSYRDFFGYEWSSTNNTSRGRVFMNYQDGDVIFGVSRNKTKVADGLDTITVKDAVDKTFLMVMKYECGDPAVDMDDTVRLYINPDATLSEAEQTGIVIRGTDPQSDRSDGAIVRLRLRQKGMNALIGGIRVGTDWKEVLQGAAVTGVSLDQTTLSIAAGATGTLVATVEPADAGDPSVTWSSSDEAVATVDANGVVTGVAAGTATITVTTTDGSFTADCAVTVTGETGISVSSVDNLSIYPNPSKGVFTIDNSEGADVKVYNMTGKVVFEQNNISSNQQIVTNLQKGMYVVSLLEEGSVRMAKMIIE